MAANLRAALSFLLVTAAEDNAVTKPKTEATE
jgi:hypothetical protein